MPTSEEHKRLAEVHDSTSGWRRWGPYVSDRAWATVREDYSADGEAWTFLPHDQARSKAYRWGEDAIAGFCDRYQLIVFAPAVWNGRDSILKGAVVWPLGSRGKPRRRCQGILLLSGRDSDRLLSPVPLQVSPGGVSVRSPRGRERPARQPRPRVRVARHWPPRRESLLRHRGGVRQVHRGRHRRPDQGHQPRSRPRATPPCPAPLVPEHLELGDEVDPPRPRSWRDHAGKLT